jgi:hypothetical protein
MLPPPKRVGRLLLLHRLAFDAELKGRLRRADFFWREAHARLRRIWPRTDLWEAARAKLGDTAPKDAQALRSLVLTELFLDTHIAFVNGRLSASEHLSNADRAFAQIAFIRDLLKLHPLPGDEGTELLAPALEAEIDALEQAKHWDDAIALARTSYAETADRPQPQERLALLYFHRCIDRLADEPKGNEVADAGRLDGAIQQIVGLLRSNSDVVLYDLLGQLHHLHSIRLANAGQFADALVACRKAQAFSPSLEATDQVMSQLRENMTKLQGQMRDIEAQLKRSSNVTLSAEGHWLRAQTNQGFRPLEQYEKSGEPERIAGKRRLAQAHKLWRDLHDDPKKTCTDEQARELFDVVAALYGS